jgi:glycosyltransferase involved in cell wall biosynthesis
MRVMLHTNAPWAGSGYGVQAKLFAPRLIDAGYETAISAFYGLMGGLLKWGGCQVYPAGMAPYGTDIVVAHARHFGADAIVALMDSWVLGPMIPDAKEAGIPVLMWAPVDQAPVPPMVQDAARASTGFLCYSQWGTQELLDIGVEQARYVPLAVDTKTFKPGDKAEARAKVGLPQDRYVVGVVAANKCPYARKGWPWLLEAFRDFSTRHDDALLYLHTEVTPAHGGWDLTKIIDRLGIADRVIVADRYLFHLGLDDAHMAAVFNGMDVLLSPSLGEGFGVPIVEAQACGTPVIIGDWTSMPELFGAGYIIQKEDATKYPTLQNGNWYIPHIDAIVEALEDIYHDPRISAAAVNKAAEYDADVVTREHLIPALEEFAGAREAVEPAAAEVFEFGAAA